MTVYLVAEYSTGRDIDNYDYERYDFEDAVERGYYTDPEAAEEYCWRLNEPIRQRTQALNLERFKRHQAELKRWEDNQTARRVLTESGHPATMIPNTPKPQPPPKYELGAQGSHSSREHLFYKVVKIEEA